MATAEHKIRELAIELSEPAQALGSYVPAAVAGKLIYTSGQLPMLNGNLLAAGKVPNDVSLAQAQAAARQAALNGLAALRAHLGSLDKISQVVRLNVWVNSSAGFTDHAKVANGASDILVDIFGASGRHTRCAIGAAGLPLNSPVELDIIAEIL